MARRPKQLRRLAAELGLDLRGSAGEHSSVRDATFDLSNRDRLGLDEAGAVELLVRGLAVLLARDREA
jgi:hypothetical protein